MHSIVNREHRTETADRARAAAVRETEIAVRETGSAGSRAAERARSSADR